MIEDSGVPVELESMATGYVLHQESMDETEAAYAAGAPSGIEGGFKASGLSYFNLMSVAAGFLRKEKMITSQRKLIDLGDDGVVFEGLFQKSGVCSGCSHSEADTYGWIANYAMTGTGPFPQQVSLAWCYLTGRTAYVGRGDTGAVPSLTIQAIHDIGVLVEADAPELAKLPVTGTNSEEDVCIRYRDNPNAFINQYKSRCGAYRSRVFRPKTPEMISDLVYSGRPVTCGGRYQMRPVRPGSNGISPLYDLGSGHETAIVGTGLLGGRLFGIKLESWLGANFYPAGAFPNHRVIVKSDSGIHALYPSTGAVWLDEWMATNPECWALDAPSSAT